VYSVEEGAAPATGTGLRSRVVVAGTGLTSTRSSANTKEHMGLDEITSFGASVRRYRLSRGYSQAQLAERAGLSLQAVGALERGSRHAPRPETLRRLGEALGLTEEESAVLDRSVRRWRGVRSPARLEPDPAERPGVFTALIGRERDEEAVVRLLRGDPRRSDPVRLLTLSGPGGVGKTRLALQVASTLRDAFADGVVWVDLAPLRDASLVAATIAASLGVRESGTEAPEKLLVRILMHRDMLVVLDNFEHLLAARAAVVTLRQSCPQLTLLVTSRTALHVRGEHEYAVGPLALPARGGSPEVVGQAAAVQLFMQRAQAIQPELTLTAAAAPVVAEVCQRLDGLPLALELAAGWVKLLTPEALLETLAGPRTDRGGALDLLVGGATDLPHRQQTLRATLDWSHDLLTRAEQTVFRQLAVFVGGCTLAAAEAVCRAPDAPPGRILSTLRSLLDMSLVRSDVPAPSGGTPDEPRLRMLETVRDYALDCLAVSGDEDATRARHAAYYVALADQASAAQYGPHQGAWYARLEREHANLRAVLVWAQGTPDSPPITRRQRHGLGLHLAGTLWQFWSDHGHLGEGRAWLAALLREDDDRGQGSAPARARALNGAGWMAAVQGDYASAATLLEESVSLYRALDDARGLAFALANRAGVFYRQADYGRAGVVYEEAHALAQAEGDRPTMIHALTSLALIARERGDHPRAIQLYEQCLAVSADLGQLEYITLGGLGRLAREQGDGGRAQALLEQALELVRRAGDTTHAAGLLLDLAVVMREQGDPERAADLLHEAADLCQAMGHREGRGVALLQLGLIAAHHGSPDEAVRLCAEALALCAADGETPRVAVCLEGLAEAWCAQGQGARAAQLCGVAEALRTRIGAPLPLRDRRTYDQMVDRLRAALGDALSTAWQTGHRLPLDEAIAAASVAASAKDGWEN